MAVRPHSSPWRGRLSRIALLAGGTLLLASPALAVKCSSESINCGGGTSESQTLKLHDTIAENRSGTISKNNSVSLHEGFWCTLPVGFVGNMAGVSAVVSDAGAPVICWTMDSLAGVMGFNIYRATEQEGPFELVNDVAVAPQSPGTYEDASTWPQSTYWYEVTAIHSDGHESNVMTSPIVVRTGGTLQLRLFPLYPNPTSGPATVRFDVPDQATAVQLAIYDVSGRRVATVIDGPVDVGRHEEIWDGCDNLGHPVSSGIYFARLVTRGKSDNQKIMVLR